jgi:hypothetical protein
VSIEQQRRLQRAKTAVEAYALLSGGGALLSGGGSFEETFSDLLADLMHYADYIDIDFDDVLDTGVSNYTIEVKENKE